MGRPAAKSGDANIENNALAPTKHFGTQYKCHTHVTPPHVLGHIATHRKRARTCAFPFHSCGSCCCCSKEAWTDGVAAARSRAAVATELSVPCRMINRPVL